MYMNKKEGIIQPKRLKHLEKGTSVYWCREKEQKQLPVNSQNEE